MSFPPVCRACTGRRKWESRISEKLIKTGEKIYEIYSGFGTS
jgi:hypothetical protein